MVYKNTVLSIFNQAKVADEFQLYNPNLLGFLTNAKFWLLFKLEVLEFVRIFSFVYDKTEPNCIIYFIFKLSFNIKAY